MPVSVPQTLANLLLSEIAPSGPSHLRAACLRAAAPGRCHFVDFWNLGSCDITPSGSIADPPLLCNATRGVYSML